MFHFKPLDLACQFVTPELYDSIMTVLLDAKDNLSDYKTGLAVVVNLDKLANSCGVDLVTLFLGNELGGDFCNAYNARLVATLQAKLPRAKAA